MPCYFSDFVSRGPLKLTTSGLSAELSAYKVTLTECSSENGGDATASQLVTEKSVTRMLVEMGYAEVEAGSPLELELQVERTMYDLDKLEQLGKFVFFCVF